MKEISHPTTDPPGADTGRFLPYPYQRLNRSAEILSVNEAWEDALGYETAEVTGEHFADYVHPSDRSAFRTAFEQVVAGEPVDPVPLAVKDAKGQTMTVRLDGRAERDDDGAFVRAHCQFIDVKAATDHETDRTNSTAVDTGFHTTEKRRKLAVEGAGIGIWDWDMETNDVHRDELLTEMLGYSTEEMGDRLRDWERLVHPEGKKRHDEALAEHISNETDFYHCDYRMKTRTGDWTWVRTMGTVIDRTEDGTPRRAVGIHLDIDELKRTQLRLTRKTEQLEALNRVVRHDIRNDMNVVYGWAEELERHVDAAGAEAVDRILTASRHVIELTEVAREFVESVGGEEPIDLKPIDLRRYLRNEIETQRDTYPETEFTVVDELPSVSVRANEMLSSVFRNLLVNAVEHNDSASRTVRVCASVGKESVEVRIADDGPGIADRVKDEVFAKGMKGLEGGTGIGLYLVDTLVDSYDGDVWVVDNEPNGSVFVVELPVADPGDH